MMIYSVDEMDQVQEEPQELQIDNLSIFEIHEEVFRLKRMRINDDTFDGYFYWKQISIYQEKTYVTKLI